MEKSKEFEIGKFLVEYNGKRYLLKNMGFLNISLFAEQVDKDQQQELVNEYGHILVLKPKLK